VYTFVTNIGLKLVIVYLVGNSILKLDLAPFFFHQGMRHCKRGRQC